MTQAERKREVLGKIAELIQRQGESEFFSGASFADGIESAIDDYAAKCVAEFALAVVQILEPRRIPPAGWMPDWEGNARAALQAAKDKVEACKP